MTSSVFTLLPEWSEQETVLLAWPHESTDWHTLLDDIERDYVALAVAISTEVPPTILCRDENHQESIRALIEADCGHVPVFVITTYNDTWCRDYGPLVVGNGKQRHILDFEFRGWGGKYLSGLDNGVNQALARTWNTPLRTVDFELEGGSIETDGQGTLLTTTRCLLDSRRRQPGTGRAEIEGILLPELGLERVLWLDHGTLTGDDTDGHVDNLVRFCSPDTLVFSLCRDPEDEHFRPLQAMEVELTRLTRADGQPYHLHGIELPVVQDGAGGRLPASYVNFLILNGSVIVPVFDCPQDQAALEAIRKCFPTKTVRPVPGKNLVRQFGGPHCATMQIPKGTLPDRIAP